MFRRPPGAIQASERGCRLSRALLAESERRSAARRSPCLAPHGPQARQMPVTMANVAGTSWKCAGQVRQQQVGKDAMEEVDVIARRRETGSTARTAKRGSRTRGA